MSGHLAVVNNAVHCSDVMFSAYVVQCRCSVLLSIAVKGCAVQCSTIPCSGQYCAKESSTVEKSSDICSVKTQAIDSAM